MKNILSLIRVIVFLPLLSSFVSCQKVVKTNIIPNEKRYVIEANLSDKDDSIKVFISRTNNIFDSFAFDGINDAVVTLAVNNNIPILINSTGEGKYSGFVKTEPGFDYFLSVRIDENIYTASCKMPEKVPIDTLFITPSTLFGKKKNLATIRFTDPSEKDNYYRFILSTDGFYNSSIFVLNDLLFNGRSVTHELNDFLIETNDRYSIDKYDWVRVEVRCIDPAIYRYFFSLQQIIGGAVQGGIPDNPISNINGGAIGYFSVHSYQLLKCVSEF